MRTISLLSASLAAILLLAFTIADPLPIGTVLPKGDLPLKDISGKKVTVKDVKKKNGILVMFSCNTCPYVVKNQQRTNEICSYAEKNDIGVIILNSNAANREGEDSFAAMQSYAKNQQYKWIYAVDENNQLADAYGASRTPECFLFDNNLKLVYHGAIDNNPGDAGSVTRKHLQIAIDEMAAGNSIAVKETRSVGCGIKRIKN